MVAEVGWGIVGLGRIAEGRIAAACSQAANSRLVAVCSRDPQKAADFASRHKALRSYDSYEAMLADPEVDAVFVCTPRRRSQPQ